MKRTTTRRRAKPVPSRVFRAGRYFGNAIWVGIVCLLLVADFIYGFVIGIGLGIADLRRALADQRREGEAKLQVPRLPPGTVRDQDGRIMLPPFSRRLR
jgi:hypothetical protein